MQPPPIQWLPVFAAVAQHKSFKKAANQLHVSPSAVSQQIKALEEYLGVDLFTRRGPRIDMTEAGDSYYKSTRVMLDKYYAGFEELNRRFSRQFFRLNASLFIAQELLFPHYLEYKKFEPNTELRIATGAQNIDFESGIADAALRFGLEDWSPLRAKLLSKAKVAPVCSPKFLKDLDPQKSLRETVNNQVLLTTKEDYPEWKHFFPSIKPRDVIVCDSFFSMAKSAEMGLGIGLGIFPVINQWVNHRRLAVIGEELFNTDYAYWIVYPNLGQENGLVESCYEWALSLFNSLPKLQQESGDFNESW